MKTWPSFGWFRDKSVRNARLENAHLENALLENTGPRRLACSRCGTAFTCNVTGPCWCAKETTILPMPADGGDCLCRDCLRQAAALPAGKAPS